VILNKLLAIQATFHLGQRYLRTLKAERKAIKRNRADYYARAWEEAAIQTGSKIESLGDGIFKITNKSHSVLVYEQYSPLVDPVGYRLIVNKAIVYKLLAKIDVPMPRYIHLKKTDFSAAKLFMSETNCPLVVKPAYGTGAGAGVTTNVIGNRRLYQALAWSRAFCPETVIEEQIKGNNYRLLFLDGELLDCIIRNPPTVTGDGVSSIRRLIRLENKMRIEPGAQLAQNLIFIDMDTKNTLSAQRIGLNTKPARGQTIKVKDVINCNRAEENETPQENPSESLISLGRKIAETIGVRLLGIDIITDDLTADLRESGGRVIEVNSPPGHFYHHLKKGKGYPVGLKLLQRVFEDKVIEQQSSRSFQQ